MIEFIITIVEHTLIHLPLIMGAYITLSLMKVPDLSIETAYTFGALCAAQASAGYAQLPLAFHLVFIIVASLLGGAIVGAVSSSLTRFGHIPHLLSAIITFGLFHGINQIVSKGAYIPLASHTNYLALFSVSAQQPELIMLVLIGSLTALCAWLLCRTQLGYTLAVYGQNPSFFSHYGISTNFVFIAGVILGNMLAGLSGYLFAQTIGVAEITMGVGKVLLCITSLVLGKVIVRTHQPLTIAVPIIGLISYFVIQQLLLKIDFDLTYFTMAQSIIIVTLLTIAYRRGKRHDIQHLGV